MYYAAMRIKSADHTWFLSEPERSFTKIKEWVAKDKLQREAFSQLELEYKIVKDYCAMGGTTNVFMST